MRRPRAKALVRSLLLVGFPTAVMGACASEPGTNNDPNLNNVGGITTGMTGATTTDAGAVTSTTGGNAGSVTSTTTGATTTTTGAATTTTTGATTTGATTTGATTTTTDGGVGGASSTDSTNGSTGSGTTTDGAGGMTSTTDGATTGVIDTGPTLEDLVGSLDGLVVWTPCGDQPSSDDCLGGGWYTNDGQAHACQGGSLEADIYKDIGGTAGEEYQVSFHFYGVAEPKNYGNGLTRDAGNGRPDLNGGMPDAWAEAPGGHQYPGSNYNTYEIRVEDQNQEEQHVYYLNSDTQEGHYTMLVDYEKTITLIGGGRVHFKVFDANCRQIKNCGASGGYPCANKARTIDALSSVMPALPQSFDPPGLGVSADHAGQWMVIDALSLQ